MPATFIAFVLFVTLATPGLAFELLRERRRPNRQYSTYRETAVVVVASVALNIPALAFVIILTSVTRSPRLADLRQLAQKPSEYASTHIAEVFTTFALMTIFALVLAAVMDWLLSVLVSSGQFKANGMWYDVVDGDSRPRAAGAVIVSVELTNGASIEGSLKGYDLDNDQALRYLVIHDHSALGLRFRAPNGVVSPIAKQWGYVVVPNDQIRLVTLGYAASTT